MPQPDRSLLTPGLQEAMKAHASVAQDNGFHLAGGSSLSLRFGHRRSVDADWFTSKVFNPEHLLNTISNRTGISYTADQKLNANTLRIYSLHQGETVESSFIRYNEGPNETDTVDVDGTIIKVASLECMVIMKTNAIVNRGEAKDFYDLHTILQQPNWNMERIINTAQQHLPISQGSILRSFKYMVDADITTEKLRDNVTAWKDVKKNILNQVDQFEISFPQT